MPMRKLRVAMRTSIRNAESAAASDNIERMNNIAISSGRSQRRNAFAVGFAIQAIFHRACPIDEIKNIGVSATWIRCAIFAD